MHMKRILIVGAGGQIGSELTVYLRKIYGDHNVVATDMRECKALGEAGPFGDGVGRGALPHRYDLQPGRFALGCGRT